MSDSVQRAVCVFEARCLVESGAATINPDCSKQIAISRHRVGAIMVEMKHC